MNHEPRIYSDEQRRELLRALGSNDDALAMEAATLLRHEAQAYARAEHDPGEILVRIEVSFAEAKRIARSGDPNA